MTAKIKNPETGEFVRFETSAEARAFLGLSAKGSTTTVPSKPWSMSAKQRAELKRLWVDINERKSAVPEPTSAEELQAIFDDARSTTRYKRYLAKQDVYPKQIKALRRLKVPEAVISELPNALAASNVIKEFSS